jgi:hypothetical protein
MLYLLLLLGYDSLPPLPDLSKITLPEPVMWIEPHDRTLLVSGYTGQYSGAKLDLDLHSFRTRGHFTRLEDWDETDTGDAEITANVILPNIWLEPQCTARYLRRDDRYTQIKPELGMTIFTKPVVATGRFAYSHWLINEETEAEALGEMKLIFDRIDYLPSLVMRGIYTDEELKPSLYAQLHISGFHVELGTPVVSGFPSPRVEIAYSDPLIKVKVAVASGVKHNTLDAYFQPELPTKYGIGIPAETVKVTVDLGVSLCFGDHVFTVGGIYGNWLHRLNISEDYEVIATKDVRETNLTLSTQNVLCLGSMDLRNALDVRYNISDSAIAFLPDYSIIDTLTVILGGLELATDLQYFSQRSGVSKSLARYYTFGLQAGYRVKFLKVFFNVHNINDEKPEVFDGYFLAGRKYAGGLEINQPF